MACKKLVELAHGEFLRPEKVGSAVRYNVSATRRTYVSNSDGSEKHYVSFSASVALSDCNRIITWEFGSREDISKIDNAIRLLKDARKAMLLGLKAADAERKVLKVEEDEDDY